MPEFRRTLISTMPAELNGTKRQELFDWLAKKWAIQGPPVCFIHSFPGTGKTSLADLLAERTKLKYVRHDTIAESTSLDDLLLELQERASEAGINDLEDALFKEGLTAPMALMRLLEKPVLVLIHEGQRFFDKNTGHPLPEILPLLDRVAKRSGYPGRLLFLTNRLVPKGEKWSEPFEIRKLEGLTLDEATRVLDDLLKEHGRGADILPAKRREIVTCLGCNPRALRTLVGCLENSSWEELIMPNPDAWIPKDTEVAPDFVTRLEEGLIQQRFGRLDPATMRFVQRLSVHRQAVKIEALNDLAETNENKDSASLRKELSSLLWLEQSAGWYSLQAVVKEVTFSKLKKLPTEELLNAHSRAADYYLRPFKAKQMVGGGGLAGSFAEVRYHLQEAKRGDELGEIAQRYTEYLRRIYPSVSPVPKDPAVLKDRIGVLSVLLKEPGAKSLEYYLARLFQARNAPGDLEQAMVHAARSTGAHVEAGNWYLRIKLENRVLGFDVAEKTLRKALKKVSSDLNLFSLYQFGAELFESNGKRDGAIDLLIKGIDRVLPEHHLQSLYQLCAKLLAENGEMGEAVKLLKDIGIPKFRRIAGLETACSELYTCCAELMAKDGRIGHAIDLLEEGIGWVPADQKVFLYQTEIELLGRTGDCQKTEQIVARGLAAIPPSSGRHRIAETGLRLVSSSGGTEAIKRLLSLGPPSQLDDPQRALADYMLARTSGDWQKTFDVVRKGHEAFPQYTALLFSEVDARVARGQATEAYALMMPYEEGLHQEHDNPVVWLKAFVSLIAGHPEEARNLAAMFAPRNYNSAVPLDEAELLHLWEAAHSGLTEPLVNNFPCVAEYVRKRGARAPIAAEQPSSPASKQPSVLAVATEWHSAHGGVSTFNRELCRAFVKEGYQVWCYVPDAKPEEITQAKDEDGVCLLSAPREAQANQDARLRNRPVLPAGAAPDLIISHDRITGPAATSLVENHFPKSKHVLFIHTAPKQIEWFKEQGDDTTATGTSELRRQLQISLARKAHLVEGVGPKLQQAIGNELHALTPPKTALEFLPGLETPFRDASPPPANECLVLGRAEDADLKGLDIAARAMAKLLAAPHQTITPTPVLVIRGAPIGTGDDLRNDLMQKTHLGANHLHIREYSSDVDVIRQDMLSSTLVLMPSRTEGFGLAALEAIALGIPVLVSDQSGLAETLHALVPEHAKNCVVHISADLETDATAWERKIDFVLSDKLAAFTRANELRNALVPHLSWEKAVRSLVEAISALSV